MDAIFHETFAIMKLVWRGYGDCVRRKKGLSGGGKFENRNTSVESLLAYLAGKAYLVLLFMSHISVVHSKHVCLSSADVLLLHILVFFWPFSAQCVGVAYFRERTSLSSRPSRCLPKRLEKKDPPRRPKWRRKRRSLRWVRVSWWPCPDISVWILSPIIGGRFTSAITCM